VFAPVAALLAAGGRPEDVGEPFERVTTLAVPEPRWLSATEVRGQIIHIDRFGNLVTNIHRSVVGSARVQEVLAGSLPVREVVGRYSDVAARCPLAMFGPDGFLQVAYNGDRADARLGLTEGIFVTVRLESPGPG
jgi:S-adenosylmethionine hydrolase